MSTRTGIEHEEILLSESAARETSLNSQIIEMELDLKSTKAWSIWLFSNSFFFEHLYGDRFEILKYITDDFLLLMPSMSKYDILNSYTVHLT